MPITGLQAIPNQPLNFNTPAADECNDALQEQYCAKYNMFDNMFYLWERFPCSGIPKLLNPTGSELVVNGDFATDASNWTLETSGPSGWSWAGGKISVENFGVETKAWQDMTGLIESKQIRVKVSISGLESGIVTVMLVDSMLGTITEDGDYSFDIGTTANDKILNFVADEFAKFSLDDVSVFETVGVTWAGTHWTDNSGTWSHDTGFTNDFSWSDSGILTAGNHYKLHLELLPRTAGTLEVWSQAGGIFTKLFEVFDEVTDYHFKLYSGDAILFRPSALYDGSIPVGAMTIHDIPHIATGQLYLTDLDGNIIIADMSSLVRYVNEFAIINPTPYGLGLDPGCYKLCYVDACTNHTYCSNCIDVRQEHDCTQLFTATCDCKAYGFDFRNTGFRLQQRLPVLKFNPVFPFKENSEVTSIGTHLRQYAEQGRAWEFLIDYIDETAHSCLITQLLCDSLRINGVYYFFEDKDYKPDQDKEGRQNQWQVRFELKKQIQDLVYNKNCGCE